MKRVRPHTGRFHQMELLLVEAISERRVGLTFTSFRTYFPSPDLL